VGEEGPGDKGNPFSINALLARLILIGGYCRTWTVPGAGWVSGTLGAVRVGLEC